MTFFTYVTPFLGFFSWLNLGLVFETTKSLSPLFFPSIQERLEGVSIQTKSRSVWCKVEQRGSSAACAFCTANMAQWHGSWAGSDVHTEGMRRRYHFNTTSMFSIMQSRLKKRPLEKGEVCVTQVCCEPTDRWEDKSHQVLQVVEGFCLTSRGSVGMDLPETSSSPRLPPDSGFYNPFPDLYYLDTVEICAVGRVEKRRGKSRTT